MSEQNNKSKEQKQYYTTLRIFKSTHEKIKKLAESEQRNIEIVGSRLLDEALALPINSEKLSQVL